MLGPPADLRCLACSLWGSYTSESCLQDHSYCPKNLGRVQIFLELCLTWNIGQQSIHIRADISFLETQCSSCNLLNPYHMCSDFIKCFLAKVPRAWLLELIICQDLGYGFNKNLWILGINSAGVFINYVQVNCSSHQDSWRILTSVLNCNWKMLFHLALVERVWKPAVLHKYDKMRIKIFDLDYPHWRKTSSNKFRD